MSGPSPPPPPPPDPRRVAVANERTKLLANALDRASTACVTIGIVTPAAGYLYNIGGFRAGTGDLVLALGLAGWSVAAVALHALARFTLGRLR